MINNPATTKDINLADIANLFHPLALTEEQAALYQPTAAVRGGANYEFHELLYERICTSPNKTHILVVGHGGCGKSTELRMLTLKLRNNNIPSITIEAREDLDLNNFSYIDIFIQIVERLTQYVAQTKKPKMSPKLLRAFYEALSTKITLEYWENKGEAGLQTEAAATISLPSLLKFVSKITASLKRESVQREELRRQIDPKMKDIIKALNALIDAINTANKNKIVIVIDGLEKCLTENVEKLFSRDVSSLSEINTHLLIACPINIYRSPAANILQGYFIKPAIMPMIKTHYPASLNKPYKDGVKVIKTLLQKRIDESFFEQGVLDEIIKMAGGSLRDTFVLVSDSAFEAYMRQRTTVDIPSFESAMNAFAGDLFYRAESKYFPTIKKIFEGEHQPRNDADLAQLLYAGVVFEYNGEGWIDLHPLIRRYIEKRPGVLD